MKFKKLNEDQISIELTFDDLKREGIEFIDLQENNKKVRAFMQGIMEEAAEQLDFELDGKPLLVEAIPKISSTIEIVVTRMNEDLDPEEQLELMTNQLKKVDHAKVSEIKKKLNEMHNLKEKNFDDNKNNNKKDLSKNKKTSALYKFESLDDVIYTCYKLNDIHSFRSSIYKFEESYYLYLDLSKKSLDYKKITYILKDFGTMITTSSISKSFLMEHGQVLINANAVKKLSQVICEETMTQ